jgi:hypothetical protein
MRRMVYRPGRKKLEREKLLARIHEERRKELLNRLYARLGGDT